jgi:pimeloyl-ACP methyl ester carboxylesterase
MFGALMHYPSLERLLDLDVKTLVVLGDQDPLMPSPDRVREVAGHIANQALLVVIEGAAHAINFSHPGELANVIRLFMADRPIVDDPDSPGTAHSYELHRGKAEPPAEGAA